MYFNTGSTSFPDSKQSRTTLNFGWNYEFYLKLICKQEKEQTLVLHKMDSCIRYCIVSLSNLRTAAFVRDLITIPRTDFDT